MALIAVFYFIVLGLDYNINSDAFALLAIAGGLAFVWTK